MADHEPQDPGSEEIEYKGGWRQPEKPGGWQQVKTESETVQTGGWRVPAMPQDLSEAPTAEGEWHLPRPEDTRFGPEDELEIGGTTEAEAVRPEDLPIPSDTSAAAPPEPDIEDSQDLETFTGLGELVVQLMEQTGAGEAVQEDSSTAPAENLDFTSTASPEHEGPIP